MATNTSPPETSNVAVANGAEDPVHQLFSQSVNDGSAQYWAAHFADEAHRPAIKAAFCFAHAMNVLTTVSPEVIAEKSVWWHEELTGTTPESARHPTTRVLVTAAGGDADRTAALVQTMHHHLHGALMSQQRTALSTQESWQQYAQLRFGSLHELIALASGVSSAAAASLGSWCGELHGLGVQRAPQFYTDSRVLTPAIPSETGSTGLTQTALASLSVKRPELPPANAVLVNHEWSWWKRTATDASPVFTGLPVGLRGMLASWQAARRAR